MRYPRCDRCPTKDCFQGSDPSYRYCPQNFDNLVVEDLVSEYTEELTHRQYQAAAKVEKESYREVDGAITPIRPRIAEIVAFSRELGMKRIGVAFCAGLTSEAERLCQFLEESGMDVASVICKCMSVEKEELGVPEETYIRGPPERGCNPVVQAELLNRADTELNLIAGLCIGHDIIFTERSEAPVTTIFVKDRMTGHNPTVPLHSSYFQEILKK